MSDERSTFYAGPRMLPLSAAISLFGTTSGMLSLLIGRFDIPDTLKVAGEIFLIIFFMAAVWMSIVGGGSLLFGSGSEDVGVLTLRGRSVPKYAWTTALAICYLAPWIALLIVILIARSNYF